MPFLFIIAMFNMIFGLVTFRKEIAGCLGAMIRFSLYGCVLAVGTCSIVYLMVFFLANETVVAFVEDVIAFFR